MTSINPVNLIQSIVDLLTADPSVSWFIDNQPDAGIFGVLAGVSAVEASRSVDGSGNRGSTIAANVEHLRWSIANASGAMRGQPYSNAWSESWDTLTADPAAWDRLRQDLRTEFETLRETIRAQQDLQGVYLNGALALIPHAAYHLGTIRQMIERVRI